MRHFRTLEKNRRKIWIDIASRSAVISLLLLILLGVFYIMKDTNSIFLNIDKISSFDLISASTLAAALTSVPYVYYSLVKKFYRKSSGELEDKKLDIKIKLLEKQLEQLEAMRSADLESIISKKD